MGQSPPICDLCRGESRRAEGSEEACLISWQPVSVEQVGASHPPQVTLMNIIDGDG